MRQAQARKDPKGRGAAFLMTENEKKTIAELLARLKSIWVEEVARL
jgi:hypothetical protein